MPAGDCLREVLAAARSKYYTKHRKGGHVPRLHIDLTSTDGATGEYTFTAKADILLETFGRRLTGHAYFNFPQPIQLRAGKRYCIHWRDDKPVSVAEVFMASREIWSA